jgi:hypothetical protein
MWAAVIAVVAVIVVAALYRRSVMKVRRSGRQLRGMGDYSRHKREIRRDMWAWSEQANMGQPPPRRSIEDDSHR